MLGISAYEKPSSATTAYMGVTNALVEKMRRSLGGQLQPLPQTITRWYLTDLETAELAADNGDLSWAAKIMRSARKDGILSGVLSTRTGGLVRLPKRFRGPSAQIARLELGHDNVRSVFDEMHPPAELALLAADGVLLGVGIAERVPVVGRKHPVLVRLDPAFLSYRWNENRWYFQSVGGPIAITPGDGRWVLHVPGGRMTPWQHGLWRCIGRAFIRKEHAALHKDNWEAKLANPARVAVAPQGAGEEQKEGHFQNVMRWGINTVFGLTPGYDIKLIESNGRGYDSFCKTIADQNEEMTIAVAGQTVTTDGGAGFQNSDIHKSIRADLIKDTADALAFTLNTQSIPSWVADEFGEDALEECAVVEWDVTPPKDRNATAQALLTAAQAITQLDVALKARGVQLDIAAVCQQFGIPVDGDQDGDGKPDAQVSPARLVTPQLPADAATSEAA